MKPLTLIALLLASFTTLFAAITPHLAEMQNPNDVNFNTKGYDFLGETVAKAIEAQLPKR